MGSHIIKAAVWGWLIVLLGVLLSAMIFHIFYLPEEIIPWVSGFFCYLASFVCGFCAVGDARKKRIFSGFWAGIVFAAGYLAVTLMFQGRARLVSMPILLLVSTLSGFIRTSQQFSKIKRNNIRKGITRL